MSQVCIFFRGLGIAYRKEVDGLDVWRVLFPLDPCHTVKFSYAIDGKANDFHIDLNTPGRRFFINRSGNQSAADSTENFDDLVLDLTGGETHRRVKTTDDWFEHGVLLTMTNAKFCVHGKYLQEFDSAKFIDVYLKQGVNTVRQDLLAHTVSASIEVEDGEQLEVVDDTGRIYLTTDPKHPERSYKMLFNNDCAEITEEGLRKPMDASKASDMQLYYKLIVDSNEKSKKFEITGTHVGRPHRIKNPNQHRDDFCQDDRGLSGRTAEPNLDASKPCMFVQVTDSDNLV